MNFRNQLFLILWSICSSSTSSSTTTKTTTTTTTSTTTTEKPVDYYFTHFDSKREHDAFKEAQKSLEDSHREKVTKVMKEWSELEERYQEMKLKDPNGAEDFRKKMSSVSLTFFLYVT